MADPDRRSTVIADEHPIVSKALQSLLNAQPDFWVAGLATTYAGLLTQASELKPDVIVLDSRLSGFPRTYSLRDLKAIQPSPLIVVMSNPLEHAAEALRNGPDGFISKTDPPEQVLHVLRSTRPLDAPAPAPVAPSAAVSLRVTNVQALALGDVIGVDWTQTDPESFRAGLEVEIDDAKRNGRMTSRPTEWLRLARLVLAQLLEQRNFYSRLMRFDGRMTDQPGSHASA